MTQLLSNFVYNLNNNSVTVSAAVRAILLLLVSLHAVNLTIEQQAAVLMAANSLLDVFTKSNTIAVGKIDEKVSAQVAHREMAGTTGTGTGLFPAVVAPVANTPAGTPPAAPTPGLPPTEPVLEPITPIPPITPITPLPPQGGVG